MRVGIATILLSLAVAGEARGAFETLPGPVPAGASVWAWPAAGHPRCAWSGGAAIGRPAEVDGLAWTHLWFRRSTNRIRLTSDAFSFGLGDLYREQALGLWISTHALDVGCRRWTVRWEDGLCRGGWTGSIEVRLRRGRTMARLIAQDFARTRPDRAGPQPILAAALVRGIASTVDAGVTLRRDRLGSGLAWSVHWFPAPWAGITEELSDPGLFTTGLELHATGLRVGLWVTPIAAIGARTGVTLSWGR